MGLPLLVGEVNPYNTSPRWALYPDPPNSAGDRLCRVIFGMKARDYLGKFDRVNLCFGRWSDQVGGVAASKLVSGRYGVTDQPIILLGARVTRAFRIQFEPFTVVDSWCKMVVLPHPSGRNLLWNPSDSIPRARAVLAEVGIVVP